MTFAPARPPLRFAVPQGWPQPSQQWVARNQGWQPPVGWLPPLAEGWPRIAPAPQGWQFWVPEPGAWHEFRQPFVKAANRQILVGGLALGIGFVVTLLGWLGLLGPTFFILWGAIVFGAIRLVTGLANLRKADRQAREALTARSHEVRRSQDAALYPQYLAETAAERAQTGRAPMSFEQLSYSLDAEPWGSSQLGRPQFGQVLSFATFAAGSPTFTSNPAIAGYAPASPWTPPVLIARSEASVRKRFWIPLAVLGGLLVLIVALAALSDRGASPAGSSGSSVVGAGAGAGAAAGAGAGAVGSAAAGSSTTGWGQIAGVTPGSPADRLRFRLTGQGPCSSASGCFQIDVASAMNCQAAQLTWGFSDSEQGVVRASRMTPVALAAGGATHVTIPKDGALASLGVVSLEGVSCP